MKKQIRMFTINEVKRYQMAIWCEEDEDCPNRRRISALERQIKRLLDKDGITDEETQREVMIACNPWRNNCAERLATNGWKVIRRKEI